MQNQGTPRFAKTCRRVVATLSAIGLALQPGCATVAPKTQYQGTLGNVAIIAATQEPEIKFEGFPRGKGEGAATGAGETFMACAGGIGGCSGDFCGVAFILILGVCGVASAVGGVVGAAKAPGAEEVSAAEATFAAALYAKPIQEALRGQTVAAALGKGASLRSVAPEKAQAASQLRDYRSLADEGVDTVVEVALTKAGTAGSGFNEPLLLNMEARVRVIRTGDNAEIFATNFSHLGESLKLSEWLANQGAPLLRALEAGYESLGSHIYDEVFLLYPLPRPGPSFLSFGLEPIAPSMGHGLFQRGGPIDMDIGWPKVNYWQPTLSWQRFPRDFDVETSPEEMGRVRNVRYDLVVAREHNLAVAEITYRREGLSEDVHTVETPLSPGTRYFWTVRARFELDGRQRVTDWGQWIMRAKLTAPSPWSFRFRTP